MVAIHFFHYFNPTLSGVMSGLSLSPLGLITNFLIHTLSYGPADAAGKTITIIENLIQTYGWQPFQRPFVKF